MSFSKFSFGWALVYLTPFLCVQTTCMLFSQIMSLLLLLLCCLCVFGWLFFCQGLFDQPLFVFLFIFEEVILEKSTSLPGLLFSPGLSTIGFFQAYPWICWSLLSWDPGLWSRFFLPLRILNSVIMVTGLPPEFAFLASSFLFISMVQQGVPLLLGPSVTCSMRPFPVVWRRPNLLLPDQTLHSRHPLECQPCWFAL